MSGLIGDVLLSSVNYVSIEPPASSQGNMVRLVGMNSGSNVVQVVGQ